MQEEVKKVRIRDLVISFKHVAPISQSEGEYKKLYLYLTKCQSTLSVTQKEVSHVKN